jgi:hypothetical protein
VPTMNFVCAANIIGGPTWAETVTNSMLHRAVESRTSRRYFLMSLMQSHDFLSELIYSQ